MSAAPQDNLAGARRIALRAALAAMPANAVLSTAEASAYCCLDVSTWENLRRQGKTPPAIRLTSRAVTYRRGTLDAWLAAQETESAMSRHDANARAALRRADGARASSLGMHGSSAARDMALAALRNAGQRADRR